MGKGVDTAKIVKPAIVSPMEPHKYYHTQFDKGKVQCFCYGTELGENIVTYCSRLRVDCRRVIGLKASHFSKIL